ncbi:MAG: kinase [Nocardiaceae bacterium]|nr:kinase [Nocardiaceae bacterium]
MTAMLTRPVADVVVAAQNVLARRIGRAIRLVDPVGLGGSGGSVVLRVRVVANEDVGLPRTLVVKAMNRIGRVEPGVESSDSAFLREMACYQFANTLPRPRRPGADMICCDPVQRLMILSDLGNGPRLSRLLSDPSRVSNALSAVAQALGRMHAGTVGREDDFAALLRRAEVAHQTDAMRSRAASAVDDLPDALEDFLGIDVASDIVDEVRNSVSLFRGGRFSAFSPSGMCPDNMVMGSDGVRFVDYEWGGFRDAMLDLAYPLTMFPGCLCALDVSERQAEMMIDAWRAEVIDVWPQVRDDRLMRRRLLEAQLLWVWISTAWFLPDTENERVAAVYDHGLYQSRKAVLPQRWRLVAATAVRAGRPDLAQFGEAVADALVTG